MPVWKSSPGNKLQAFFEMDTGRPPAPHEYVRALKMTDEKSIPEKMGIPDYEFRLVFGGTTVDYDIDKEETNRRKHGYSLLSAVHILERLIFPFGNSAPHAMSDAFLEKGKNGKEEVRHMHLSIDDSGKVVFMVTTMRPEEIVRVISFRRASEQEREKFRELTGYVEP